MSPALVPASSRGAPTVSSRIGSRSAVLVGDFWLARAVDMVVDASNHEEIVGYFSKTLVDLAEGEMLQLQKAGTGDTDEDDYYRIIYSKTASLFEAAIMAGAVSSGAGEEYLDAARKYAVAMGLAFQIKDDILDYTGDRKVGKPVGVGLKSRRCPYWARNRNRTEKPRTQGPCSRPRLTSANI